MRVAIVETQEEYRMDKVIIRIWGTYSERYKRILIYFNPRLDVLDLRVGTKLLIPSESDIRRIKKFRGYYDLVGD